MKTSTMTREQVVSIIKENGADREKILKILLDLQDASGQNYISKEVADIVAEELDMTVTKVFEVITFYSMIYTEPQAKYVIEVCNSTPCYFTKAATIVNALEKELSIKEGEATEDGMFIYHKVPCFGACDVSPAVKVNHKVYGPLDTEEKVINLLNELKAQA